VKNLGLDGAGSINFEISTREENSDITSILFVSHLAHDHGAPIGTFSLYI
jgi:hypothetical protein